ncbi:SDR family oxidoreductase [Sinomonas susongensis]|uniref:SDR family oxidoreductase n=1 Tax=Sinomonas susongensis TaxID=1324851 RepID=UPI0011099778|nr:NAD(P)H-binding protein [Sinomonas susongensis]
MALLAVAGGTGQAGSAVVLEALARGYEVRAFSRRLPPPAAAVEGVEYVVADAATGVGLAAALDGAEVLVDALEGRGRAAQRAFPEAGRRLLAAAHGSGVRRAVMLSIAQCDQIGFGYYRSKVAKEKAYDAAKVPTAVVRASQFHSLLAELFAYGSRFRVVPSVRRARMQPIDVADVARALVEAAAEEAGGHTLRTVSGPETRPVHDFAQEWKTAVGSTAGIIDLPVPGRFFSEGRNLAPGTAFGTTTFAQWLESHSGDSANLS